jgi:FAD/FMN-containing dehydrogenase
MFPMKNCFLFAIFFSLTIAQANAESWNDISRLNPEVVSKIIKIHSQDDVIAILSDLPKDTRVAISGTRHSQGGHIVYPNGIVLDMTSFNEVMSVSPKEKLIIVQSGATWAMVQEEANQHGLAVKVMQSSNIFSVGGSLSANIHGRDPRFGPLIETVRSIKVVLATGDIIKASRSINSDLFMAAIGGYGLLGVIIEAEIELTDNLSLKKETNKISVNEYADELQDQAAELSLHYGRCSFVPGKSFLNECYSTDFSSDGIRRTVSNLEPETNIKLNTLIFGASRKSDLGKATRWELQKRLLDKPGKQIVIDRNSAMQPDVRFLTYSSPDDTDILQEYFVPVEAFPKFFSQLKVELEKYEVNLLSITLRYLKENHESYLTYATDNMIAVVLYVNIELTDQSIQIAQEWTRKLVDLSLKNRGTYYLTYQRFPSLEQFELAYPRWRDFMEVKCKYDPYEVFSNKFYEQYLKAAYNKSKHSDAVNCAGV